MPKVREAPKVGPRQRIPSEELRLEHAICGEGRCSFCKSTFQTLDLTSTHKQPQNHTQYT